MFLLIFTQLSNRKWGTTGRAGLSLFQDYSKVFEEGHNLKRWLANASITGLPMGVVVPFVQPFAHDFKGADPFS